MTNPTPNYPSYPWMIQFCDLQDQIIIKKGETYLTSYPDADNNYFYQTAAKFISFVNSFNIDVTVLNALTSNMSATNHIHYLVREWLINCLQMMVCENNFGLNDVTEGVQNDVYYVKCKWYSQKLVSIQSQIRYETIVTGALQMNQTRAGGTFRLMF